MVSLVSTRVQLRRAANLDRGGALAYQWRTTTTHERGRRSWTEGVLLADQEQGVTRLGPDLEGFATAAAVLADVRRLTGRLPVMVDLRFDRLPTEPTGEGRAPRGRKPRYDRSGQRGETLGERAARLRRHGDDDG